MNGKMINWSRNGLSKSISFNFQTISVSNLELRFHEQSSTPSSTDCSKYSLANEACVWEKNIIDIEETCESNTNEEMN